MRQPKLHNHYCHGFCLERFSKIIILNLHWRTIFQSISRFLTNIATRSSPTKSNTMLEKKHLVFLAGATAPPCPPAMYGPVFMLSCSLTKMNTVQCHHFGYFPASPLAFFLSFATVLLRVLLVVVVVVAFLMSLSMLLVSVTVSFYGTRVLAKCPPPTSKLEEL